MAPDGVVVRAAAARDAASVAAILAAGTLRGDEEDPASPHLYAEAIERIRAAGGEVFVAEDCGEVVGVCQAMLLEHLQHRGGHVAELESVHVAALHRGRGIGAQMLEAAVAWARSRGCYRVQLTTNAVRTDAHRFYDSHGFAATHVGFKRYLG